MTTAEPHPELPPHLPIGVFDSGVGGLTVLRELMDLLPGEEFRYLGDTARLPYGAKSEQTIVRYALQSSAHLLGGNGEPEVKMPQVKMLVVACNTASSVALPALEAAHPGLPVVGVVRPGAQAACDLNRTGRMAVIATEATVRGGAYQRAVLDLCPKMRVEAQACTLFVALAEEGWTGGALVEAIIKEYLAPLLARFGDRPPDSLVLGCTHFPVLATAIQNVVGPEVMVIDSARTTAREVRRVLKERGLLRGARRSGSGSCMDAAGAGEASGSRASGSAAAGSGSASLGGAPPHQDDAANQANAAHQDATANQDAGPDQDNPVDRDAPHVQFFATDGPERFARVGSIFLGRELRAEDVGLVDL